MADHRGILDWTVDLDDDSTTAVHDQGRIVLQVGLLATLYLKNAHGPEQARHICACVDEYLEIAKSHLRWASNSNNKKWLDLRKQSVPPPREWVLTQEPRPWHVTYHAGETYEDASSYELEVLVGAEWDKFSLSYFHAALPLSWVNAEFIRLIHSWCERLTPYHGYAGLGLMQSLDEPQPRYYEDVVYRIAQHFPGLEIDYPPYHSNELLEGIKGVNWLTILGGHFVEKLGGAGALRARLNAKEFGMYPFAGGGVLIQAGERPELGDTEKSERPRLMWN